MRLISPATRMRALGACTLVVLMACSSASDGPAAPAEVRARPSAAPSLISPDQAAPYWTPSAGSRWQYQLQPSRRFPRTGGIDVDICVAPFRGEGCVRPDVFDIDLYEVDGVTPNSKATSAIHSIGARAVCYIDAGSIETYRPDYGRFVAFDRRCSGCLIGEPFSEVFSDENWANITNARGQRDFLLRMMRRRVRSCAAAGFDGVEFDVVDAYAQGRSVTGWRIGPEAQLAYNTALAEIAHRYGLSVGLKNDLGQIRALLPHFDFAINEQCFQYEECDPLGMFVAAGKPVFQVEYRIPPRAFCPTAGEMGFSSIRKARDYSLFGEPWVPCR